MPRFITNRWWTFILALVLGLGLSLAGPTYADLNTGKMGSGDGSGGGPPAPGNGDPDIPITSAKRLVSGGGAQSQPSYYYGVRTVGDSRVSSDSALMWRLLVVMRALRGFYFHF